MKANVKLVANAKLGRHQIEGVTGLTSARRRQLRVGGCFVTIATAARPKRGWVRLAT